MRTMYDSVTAGDIPIGAEMVAGYIDGRYRWSDADWGRFPHSVKVRIATLPQTDDGDVLDVEAGDATPDEAPGWVQMRRASGANPTVYTGDYQWAEVRAAFAAQHVPEPRYWIARWSGRPGLIDYTIATQYANPTLAGGHYDLSSVADFWPGIDDKEEVVDRQTYADQIEPFVKETIRVMIEQDGETRAAIAALAPDANVDEMVRAIGKKLAA